MSEQSQPQRRLNRAQIQEILERNIALYRDEDHFETYLVELALYLLEYEYDWSDSGPPPPPAVQRHHAPAPTSEPPRATESRVQKTPLESLRPHAPVTAVAPAAARNGNQTPSSEKRFVSTKLQPVGAQTGRGSGTQCPYCGTTVGDASLCPTCKNLVR